jgi:phosphatidylserine synthase
MRAAPTNAGETAHRPQSFLDGFPTVMRAFVILSFVVAAGYALPEDSGVHLLWGAALVAGLLSTSSA